MAEILGQNGEVKVWKYAANHRKDVIYDLMWSKRRAFFFDYNYLEKSRGSVYSLAGYFTLWAGVANEHQANKLVMQLAKFDSKGGLSTTASSFMYAPLFGS